MYTLDLSSLHPLLTAEVVLATLLAAVAALCVVAFKPRTAKKKPSAKAKPTIVSRKAAEPVLSPKKKPAALQRPRPESVPAESADVRRSARCEIAGCIWIASRPKPPAARADSRAPRSERKLTDKAAEGELGELLSPSKAPVRLCI